MIYLDYLHSNGNPCLRLSLPPPHVATQLERRPGMVEQGKGLLSSDFVAGIATDAFPDSVWRAKQIHVLCPHTSISTNSFISLIKTL